MCKEQKTEPFLNAKNNFLSKKLIFSGPNPTHTEWKLREYFRRYFIILVVMRNYRNISIVTLYFANRLILAGNKYGTNIFFSMTKL